MKSLLIVVDFQNDFVSGSLGFEGAKALESKIADKIRSFRSSGGSVAFTFDTHADDYLDTQEGKRLPVPHCIENSLGWQLYGSIAELIEEGDRRFNKPTFGSASLFDWLRATDFERVELAGLVSSICVISNAILAKTALPEAEIVVDAECTAGSDDKLHNAALDVMAGLQITILNRNI